MYNNVSVYFMTVIAFSILSIQAMEKAEKVQECYVRTTDMKSDDKAFAVPLPVAQMFQTLKNLLDDFSPEERGAQEFPLPFKQTTLAKVISLIDLSNSHSFSQEIVIDRMCESCTAIELVEMAQALHYMDGPPKVLTGILTKLAQKLHNTKFEASCASICEYIDEILPTEVHEMLNEIFLFKFRNISSFVRVLENFKTKKPLKVAGDFMVLDGVLFDLRRTPAHPVCTFNDACMCPNGKYLAGRNDSNFTAIVNVETGDQAVIVDSGVMRFINEKTLSIGPSNYSVETGVPQEDKAYFKEISEVLVRNKVPQQDIESIYKQLPRKTAVKVFSPSAQYLALLLPNTETYDFHLLDISNPKQIKRVWRDDATGFVCHDNRQLIVRCVDRLIDFTRGTVDYVQAMTFLDLSTLEKFNLSLSSAHLLSGNSSIALEKSSRVNKVLESDNKLLFMGAFIKNLASCAKIPLLARLNDTSRSQLWFSPSDDECSLINRKMNDGSSLVTKCLLPVKLLSKCSFGQLVMLLNALKRTPNADNPYFKQLYENLPQDIKDLYFTSSSKTHFETMTLEPAEQIECAVENDDIREI